MRRQIRFGTLVTIVALVALSCGGTPAAQSSPTVAPTDARTAAAAPAPTPAPTFVPSRAVELVVQAAAGGGSDIFARRIADVLAKEKLVSQPINVVNKAGGSGAVAYAYVQQKATDPHVLATVTLSYLSTPMQQATGFTYKDFTNFVVLAVDDFIAIVKAESPYKDLKDLIAAAKAKPKEIKVGGTQVGSSDSIIPALIEQQAGVQFNYITFKSGGEVNAALLGGTVDFAIANPGESLSLIEGKKLRAVASFSPERLKGSSVPTAKEQGTDVVWEQFRGIIGSGGLTSEQRSFWEKALTQMTKSADWQKYLDENTLRPLVKTGAEAQAYLDAQNTSLKAVLTKLGLVK